MEKLNIVSLNEVIEVLQNLNAGKNNIDPYIDTVEFLNNMQSHEFDYDIEDCVLCDVCGGDDSECEECEGEGETWKTYSADEWLQEQFELGYMTRKSLDNSYNWGSPLLNDIDFTEYYNENTEEKFIELKVHLYGDIRGNYTPNMWFACDAQTMLEELYECSKNLYYEVDGQEYCVTVSPTRDTADVYDESGIYKGQVSPLDLDRENPAEIIKEIL